MVGMAAPKNREVKNADVSKKGALVAILRMVLWTSKGWIKRWKIDEVGERIIDGNCKCGCMHKQGC